MRDRVEKDVVELREGEMLVEDFCGVFRKESKREAVLRVFKDERREAG